MITPRFSGTVEIDNYNLFESFQIDRVNNGRSGVPIYAKEKTIIIKMDGLFLATETVKICTIKHKLEFINY